jgi:hypothetical protein
MVGPFMFLPKWKEQRGDKARAQIQFRYALFRAYTLSRRPLLQSRRTN